jgi:hypothetical protein
VNIERLREYVELDTDDVFTDKEIGLWFNKGIENYNLIEPLTEYPGVEIVTQIPVTPPEGKFYYTTDYTPLGQTFMLGIMLPFIVSAVKGQEFANMEKEDYYEEFIRNARTFKLTHPIDSKYLLDKSNEDLGMYQLGANVFLSDMTRSPMSGTWTNPSLFKEIVIKETEEE